MGSGCSQERGMEGGGGIKEWRKGQVELLMNALLTFALVNTDLGIYTVKREQE